MSSTNLANIALPLFAAPGRVETPVWTRYWDTLGARVVMSACGVVTGVLAPRLLGPAGRGELAAVTLWPITLLFVGSLGLDRAAVYFAAKRRDAVARVAGACLAMGSVQSLAVILAGLFIIPRALRSYGPGAVRLGLLFLLAAPALRASALAVSLLLGRLRTGWYNVCLTVAPGVYALGMIGLYLAHVPSIRAVVLAQMAGYVLAAAVAVWIVRRRLLPHSCSGGVLTAEGAQRSRSAMGTSPLRWSQAGATDSIARDMLKYGLKSHAGDLASRLNQRLDQLLISLLLPSAQLGIYVAAIAFTDALTIVPRAIGVVTLASGANTDSAGAWLWARRSLGLTALWLVPAAVALWLACPYLLPRLFGAAFAPAVLPCRILILGSCATGLSTVLYEAARSVNRPEIPSYAEGVGLVATVLLLAALLKPYGIAGAAAASTGAYLVTLGVAVAYVVRWRRTGRTQAPGSKWEPSKSVEKLHTSRFRGRKRLV